MKNLTYVIVLLLLVACNSHETNDSDSTTEETPCEDRAIGFNTVIPENKWHLGTDEAIQVVKDLDKVWAARDWDAMKSFMVDTAKFYFPDGRVANSPDEFIEFEKEDDMGSETTWTFDYAYSVDLNPASGGEHVQAGFTVTSIKDGATTKEAVHEWYYVIEGKIITWRQYKRDIKDE